MSDFDFDVNMLRLPDEDVSLQLSPAQSPRAAGFVTIRHTEDDEEFAHGHNDDDATLPAEIKPEKPTATGTSPQKETGIARKAAKAPKAATAAATKPTATAATSTRQQLLHQFKRSASSNSSTGRVETARKGVAGGAIPEEVEKMAHMTARQRVLEGMKRMKSQHSKNLSSAFADRSDRMFGSPKRNEHQIKRDQISEQRITNLRAKIFPGAHSNEASTVPVAHVDPNRVTPRNRSTSRRTGMASPAFERNESSSSWARDTTQRGTYLLHNWKYLPQTVPRREVDSTPGPGAYTSPLHFLGA